MMAKDLAQIASASVRFESALVRLATELAHGRRRGFDPVAPASYLSHLQCKHRNRSAIHPFYWKCNTLRRRARADYIQRQVVVWRRYRQIGFGAELILVIDQWGVILGEEQLADSVLKRNADSALWACIPLYLDREGSTTLWPPCQRMSRTRCPVCIPVRESMRNRP